MHDAIECLAASERDWSQRLIALRAELTEAVATAPALRQAQLRVDIEAAERAILAARCSRLFLGPPLNAVHQWAAQAVGEWRRLHPGAEPSELRFIIWWADGNLDAARSRVYAPTPPSQVTAPRRLESGAPAY